MLVYREQRRPVSTARMLADLDRQLAASVWTHDAVVRLLIDLGMLEAAMADALTADVDALDPVLTELRGASTAAGHLLWHSWRGTRTRHTEWAARARAALAAARAHALPGDVTFSVPEGYAHYAVYPECYLEAAERCAHELGIERAVCLGIRSIGTSLSAAVTAALEELGSRVLTWTLRPRGHPFDRTVRWDDALGRLLRAHERDTFVLVDEGPGISGSSFAGAARALNALGVPDERIVLMPSWHADGSSLRSIDARDRWRRHPRYTVTFEESWLRSGRLDPLVEGRTLQDVSAGHWRPLVFEHVEEYPAVQPQHERRKLLARDPDLLLRFAGLGAWGELKLERARALSEAGFGPRTYALSHGFLVQERLAGAPLRRGDAPAALLRTAARYLAYLRRCCPAQPGPQTDLREILTVNVVEALDEAAGDRLRLRLRGLTRPDEPPTAIDGRMLPHEWIRTASGYRKTDALDHGDDHFHPGPQDIAWDVAGACFELELDRDRRRAFIEQYRRASGDRSIARRLPYFALAYLACRVGYVTLAAETLGDSPDGLRFAAEAARYRGLLDAELEPGAERRWDA